MDPKKKALFDLLNRCECPVWTLDIPKLLKLSEYLARCGVTVPGLEETKEKREKP